MPRGNPEATPEERFLQRCVETPCKYPTLSPCWIWTGGTFYRKRAVVGYGQVQTATYGTRYAHQFACSHWNASPLPVEPGYCIKHSCDTMLCVNPDHLSYGPLYENIMEMKERNPTAFGRILPTDAELSLLRLMISENTPRREMERRIGHSRSWIDRIVRDYSL